MLKVLWFQWIIGLVGFRIVPSNLNKEKIIIQQEILFTKEELHNVFFTVNTKFNWEMVFAGTRF